MRKEISRLRDQLSLKERKQYSEMIQRRITELSIYQEARTILYFVSFRSEVDTIPLIQDGLALNKRVVLPISDPSRGCLTFSEMRDCERELSPGAYGILEPKKEFMRPVQAPEIDFVLMPGLVFDLYGYRIGYGGGYYDRFLGELASKPSLIAIAFDLQIYNEPLPYEEHDIPVDFIATEKRLINCRENRKKLFGRR